MTEPWMDKRGLARYLACSIRSIGTMIAEGCPHAVILGRVKFRPSEVEVWLERSGRLERRGQTVDTVPDNGNGPAARERHWAET